MNKLIKILLVIIVVIYWIPLLIWRYYGIISAIPLIPIFWIEHNNWNIKIKTYKRDYVNYWLTPSIIGNYDRFWCRTWKWMYFHSNFNRNIEKEWYYDHCEKNWKWFEYNEDGSLWIVTNYNWDNNRTSTWYYENWDIEFTENYRNWQKDWQQVKYYKNGKIQAIENYKNWQKNWNQIYYYNNGNTQKIENYKYIKENWMRDNSKKDWTWIWYKENGDIEKTETYHDWFSKWEYDMITWKYFYENGPIKEETKYRKWKIISHIEYDEDGNIINEFKSDDY